MEGDAYTFGRWVVKPGHDEVFVRAWRDVAAHLRRLPEPATHGWLLADAMEPQVHYALGLWPRVEAIEAMRADPVAPALLEKMAEHCDGPAGHGLLRVVAEEEG
jgi:hypothetical protein